MCDSHLGVKDAGGSLDNAGRSSMGLDLEDLASGVGDDGRDIEDDILGIHVEDESERHRVLFAGRNRHAIAQAGKVANDGSGLGGALGQRLGGLEEPTDKCDVKRAILLVLDLDERLGGAAINKLHAEDVGLGEGGHELGLEGRRGGRGLLGGGIGLFAVAVRIRGFRLAGY